MKRSGIAAVVSGLLYTATVGGSGGAMPAPPVMAATRLSNGQSLYHPLTPARIYDSRVSGGPLGAAQTRDIDITGAQGVPDTGVTAVALHMAVTQQTAPGWLTVFPTGETQPLAATLNYGTGGPADGTLAIAKVPTSGGDAGKVTVYNSAGSVQLVLDVEGYFTDQADLFTADTGETLTFVFALNSSVGAASAIVTPFVARPDGTVVEGAPTPMPVSPGPVLIPPITIADPAFGSYQVGYQAANGPSPTPVSVSGFATGVASRDGSQTQFTLPPASFPLNPGQEVQGAGAYVYDSANVP